MATEESTATVLTVTDEVLVEADKPDAKPAKSKKAKKPAAPKKKTNHIHPSYFEMIQDAIVTLKEKTGSSQQAITKFIEEKHKNLAPNFRKLLLVQLKKLVASDKLVKVKSSFKLPGKTITKSAASAAAIKKPATAAKPKVTVAAKDKKAPVKAKAKPKAAVAFKPTAAAKVAAKPNIATQKPKVVVAKRKEASKSKPKEKPVKVARTSTRATPGKKPAPAPVKTKPVKKGPAKSVKAKTVKSPAKKAALRRVKK